ncbi:MAG: ABC transporter ATP-binding protein, partial [Planctomycetes bacterium]|nr:ABC transporter ATP-binding protein [Planctomycetota bacterium]
EDLDGGGIHLANDLFSTEVEIVRRGLGEWMECITRYPVEIAALGILVITIHPMLALQTLLLLSVMAYVLHVEFCHTNRLRRLASDRMNGGLRSLLTRLDTARLIRGLGLEQSQHEQFAEQLKGFNSLASIENAAIESARTPRIRVILCSCAVGAFLLFLIATRVLLKEDELTPAAAGIFIASWGLALPAYRAIIRSASAYHEASIAADKIQRYLDQLPSVSQAVGAKFLQPLNQTLHFESVGYTLPSGRPVLDQVDLKLSAGRLYGLVSTDPLEAHALGCLLPRFIEPQKGRILFDGEDIAWATLESLRAETVLIGRDDPPLSGTVLDNIRGGVGSFTLQQATEAAKTTHAHNFIVRLPGGYETVLSGDDGFLDVG